jgi:hypothetical protein
MAQNNKGVFVATPRGGESVRHLAATKKDRAKHSKQFREQKEYERKIKEERFAAIRDKRKNKPGGEGGGGINVEVTSD